MGQRAHASGIQLSERDAAIVKGMLARGDRQHDIAAWFGVNGGRIAEISTRRKFGSLAPAEGANLPPVGPYPNGRDAQTALTALQSVKAAIEAAEAAICRKC